LDEHQVFMKTILALLMLVSLSSAHGQFQLQATMVLLEPLPPSTNDWRGEGMFTLQGNTLSCRVVVAPYGSWVRSEIRAFGVDGSVLFELPLLGCQPPLLSDPGACVFRSNLSVTDSAIADLMANNWYVTATYRGITREVSMGGQIVLVPEPSAIALLVSGGAASLLCFRVAKPFRLARLEYVRDWLDWLFKRLRHCH
jgi:hypothetical protein